MTTYTFQPNSATLASTNVDWANPAIWNTGVVPNSSDADVLIPLITSGAANQSVLFDISIDSSSSFQIRSLQGYYYIELKGHLNSTDLNIDNKSYLDVTGSLSTHTLEIGTSASMLEAGVITSDSISNSGTISSNNANINTYSLTNNGTIIAYGDERYNISFGGFQNYASGVLTGGTYRAVADYAQNAPPAHLRLSFGGIINVDAATIELNSNSTIESFDASSQQFVPLTASLHEVSSAGSLVLTAGSYEFSSLAVSGQVVLAVSNGYGSSTHFSSSDLAVNRFGKILGEGFIDSSLVNNGVVEVDGGSPEYRVSGPGGKLKISGAITGQGTIEIVAGYPAIPYSSTSVTPGSSAAYSTIELAGAVAASQTVQFDNNVGQLILDQPSTFAGAIAPSGSGDTIVLQGFSANATKTYIADGTGGSLMIKDGSNTASLRFLGSYDASNFTLSAGPQVYSSDPPSLLITVSTPTVTPTQPSNPNPPVTSTPAQPVSSAPTVSNEVGLLYETILGRAADPQGLATSVGQVAQGISLASEAGAIVASSEAQALYGSQTDAQFVSQLFSNAYGTAAASARNLTQAVRLVGRLDAGTISRADVAAGVALGSPHLQAAGVTLPGGLIDPALSGTVTTDPHSAGGITELVALTLLGTSPTGLDLETGAQAISHGGSALDVAGQFLSGSASTLTSLSDTQFIDQLYRNAFARTPDAGGLATYQAALASGTSRAAVTADVALSQEHINDVQGAFSQGVYVPSASSSALARLYHGILGRAPDIWGLLSDSHLPQDASTLSNRAGTMLGSIEYASRFGQMSDTAFVSSLYQNALGRTPDAGGLSTYTGLLASGASRATVALDISESQEATRHLAPQIENGFRFT